MMRPAAGLVALACAAFWGCAERALTSPPSSGPTTGQAARGDPTGLWVMHVAAGPYDPYVQVLDIGYDRHSSEPLTMSPLPTKSWAGDSVLSLAPVRAHGHAQGQTVTWSLTLPDSSAASLVYTVVGDTAIGTMIADSGGASVSSPLVGLRISPAILRTQAAVSRGSVDSTPMILLRLDDSPPSDRDFIARLRARGLYAELAVPTAFVGRSGRPTWAELHLWAEEGFSVAAHSRVHAWTAGSTLEFMAEVLGSLADLAHENLPTEVFVQPGTWEDSLYFNSPAKLRNWRGAIFQTFTRVFEAYARPAITALPMPDSMAMGLGHVTISNGVPASDILNAWGRTRLRDHFQVLMLHSYTLSPSDTLDWFLDTLAAAVRGGRIRLAHSSLDALLR